MKTIKSILIATTLICAAAVSTMSAQQAAEQTTEKHEFKVAKGDTVMINRECQKYLTGERPSVWVWDRYHTVRQLGSKRFPEGILLMNIYSWICEDCLINVNGHAKEAAEQAKAEQAEEKAAYKEKLAEEKAAEKAAREDSIAAAQTAREDSIAAERAAREAAHAAAEAAAIAAADSAARAAEQQQTQLSAQEGDSLGLASLKHNYDRFTIGVRGGASSLLHSTTNGNWTCGFDVLLDLQYAHYWAKDDRPVDLGLIVGLGIGYHQSGLKSVVDNSFSTPNINYSLVADQVKENDGQIQLEVPLMFSLIHDNGLFFNIGPKFMIPVYTPYNQTITNPHINAYFPATGVTVSDEVITGMLTDDQLNTKGTDNGNQFAINIMLTAEIGYEWTLKSGNSLGLGAYANYSVFNTFKNNASNQALVDVTEPSASSVAVVNVLSATNTYANKLGYFDAGIKLAYHFNFPKKQYKKYKDTSKLF